jgi:hypothetical protein
LGRENDSWLWRRRMGHMNFDTLVNIIKKELVREMFEISKPSSTMCKHCLHGKQTRKEFISKEYYTTKPLEIMHTGLCEPMRIKGMNGEQYFMLLIDDYTRMTAVSFLKKKSKAFGNFKVFKEMVENDMDSRIKCLRSYNGGEFISK